MLTSKTLQILFSGIVALSAAAGARVADPVKVRVGVTSSSSDAGFYIADKKGYFRKKGLEVTLMQMFRTIALPGAMPHIMSGIKLGLGLGLGSILISIAQMIGAKSGLGFMVCNAWELLAVENMYVGLIVIALLGFILSVLLNELARLLVQRRTSR